MSKLQAFCGEQCQDWVEIAFSGWGDREEEARVFAQIKGAILGRHYMKIAYSGSGGALIEREIKPLKMCFKNQAWYLYAYCCLREDYRFFKLKRMAEITVLDKRFEAEPVGKVLQEADKEYSKNASPIRVALEISRNMAFRAYEELTDISVTDSGELFCMVDVTDINWFISYVLSYGSHMRVLEALDMKEKVMQEIDRMKKMY